jgi:peptidoglycan/xylan/chitin deacetylase (PgdA/CDA1 family)
MRSVRVLVVPLAIAALAACGSPAASPGTTTPPRTPAPSSSGPASAATSSPTTTSSTGPRTTSAHPTSSPPRSSSTTHRPGASTTTARPPTNPTPPATLSPALRDGVVTRVPTSRKVVALTFDAGAGAQGAPSVLATLAAEHVPASFFATGTFASANPSLTRQMAAIGPVGNHSWSHPHFPLLSASAVASELSRTRLAILAATGRDPRPFFRFPFGEYDSRTLTLVHQAGYGAVGWTTDSLGWKGTSGGMSVDSVVARVLAGRTPGQVVLMHVGANPDDHTTLDAVALPRIIAGYRAAGYSFTTLDALR